MVTTASSTQARSVPDGKAAKQMLSNLLVVFLAKAEQNDRHEKFKYKVYNKRRSNRLLRRAAKRNPKDAPKKHAFSGYSG